MLPSVVYKLNAITDDPQFDSFILKGDKSKREEIWRLFDFDRNDFPKYFLNRGWCALEVEGPVGESDYPCILLSNPAFSSHAIECLGEFLEPNGEILPLITDEGDYFFYNITSFSDSLNVSESDGVFPHGESRPAVGMRYFSFDQNKLADHSIFRIPQLPGAVFVTDHFVAAARAGKLRGMEFTKVWPLDAGVIWSSVKDRIILD